MKKFAFVVEGEVFHIWQVNVNPDGSTDGLVAGLESRPTIIEIPEGLTVLNGWTFDGTTFVEPEAT